MTSVPPIAADKAGPFQFNLTRSLLWAEPVAICQVLQDLTWRQVLSAVDCFARYDSTKDQKDTYGINVSELAPVAPSEFVKYYKALNEKSSVLVARCLQDSMSKYPLPSNLWSVRRKRNCAGHNCIHLDYDDVSLFVPNLIERLQDFLNLHRLNFLLYTTFSGGGKFRCFIPLNNAVSYSIYKECAATLVFFLGPLAAGLDLTCFDVSRFFFAPNFRVPKERIDSYVFAGRFDGRYLSTELLTKFYLLYKMSGVPVHALSHLKRISRNMHKERVLL